MTKYFLCCLIFMFSCFAYSQTDSIGVSKIKYDSANKCITGRYNDKVVSKEINTKLFYYKANYLYGTRSFIEAKLNLLELFDTIIEFVDSSLKQNLKIEFPLYEFRVETNIGYSYLFNVTYKEEKCHIYRDCGCGYFKKQRVYGGRFNGIGNQLFNKKNNFSLMYRSVQIREFEYEIVNGTPSSFISYQDSNVLDKKIFFKNGLIDTIESYYNDGSLRYKFSIRNGELDGDFIYFDSIGNELLKVNFHENEVNTFVSKDMEYEYYNVSKSWLPTYRALKTNQTDRKW